MADEPSTGGRNRCPDFIPDGLLAEHEETANFLVATHRSLSGIGRLGGLRAVRLRLAAAKLVRWWPLAVWLAAGSATGLWLADGTSSTALFVIASTMTVLAITGSLWVLWSLRTAGAPELRSTSRLPSPRDQR